MKANTSITQYFPVLKIVSKIPIFYLMIYMYSRLYYIPNYLYGRLDFGPIYNKISNIFAVIYRLFLWLYLLGLVYQFYFLIGLFTIWFCILNKKLMDVVICGAMVRFLIFHWMDFHVSSNKLISDCEYNWTELLLRTGV